MPNCAHCTIRSCNNGTTEKAPANCPGRFTTKEKELARYSEEDKRTFVAAAEVEAEGYCQKVRVQEIMDYARKCGYKHLGVAHCIGLRNEARVFADILKDNGFEVETVCCKVGGVDKSEMGVGPNGYVGDCEQINSMAFPPYGHNFKHIIAHFSGIVKRILCKGNK